MGHLINPISFRLGYSRNWGFSGALMESKSQYFYLNSKYYNLLLFFKRIFSLQTFEKMGILFSHLRFVNSLKSDIVLIYLYDGPFQNDSFIFYKYLNRFRKLKKILKYCRRFFKKFMKRTFVFFYYFKTLEFIYDKINDFLEKLLKFKVIKFMYFISQIKSNVKIIDNIYFIKSFFFKLKIKNIAKFIIINLFLSKLNNFLYSCFIFDYIANMFLKIEKNNFILNQNNFLIFFSLLKSVDFLLIKYKIYNINLFIKIYNFFFDLKFLFFQINNLSFLDKRESLKYLKNISDEFIYEYKNIKELSIFFIININLKIIINNLFCDFLEGLTIQRYKFYDFCQKFLFLFKQSRKKKFIFLNFFFKFLVFFTSNLFVFLKNIIVLFKPFFFNTISSNLLIYFKNISKKEITASLISKYICIRLRQKFSLKEIIRPILKDLTSNPIIKGFKLSCCGRFTKKEIATYRWERRGRTSLNTINANIDYSFNYVILKYSVCGIKVWLHKNSDYKYFFKKWFENFKFFQKKKKNFYKQKKNYKGKKNNKFYKQKKNYKRRKNNKLENQKKSQSNITKIIKIKLINLALKKAINPFV